MEKGWKAHVLGEAPHKFPDAVTAIKELRVLPSPPPSPFLFFPCTRCSFAPGAREEAALLYCPQGGCRLARAAAFM